MTAAIALATTAALFATAYALIVPSDTAPLGNLADVVTRRTAAAKRTKKPHVEEEVDLSPRAIGVAYPEDYWEEGGYVDLSHGKTHYFLLGPPTGPRLLAIHGITAGWTAMPHFIEQLAAAGFRVLVYDLYGRGYSAAPGVPYHEDLYVGQAAELMDALGWEKAHVLGYSLGGAIATAFAARWEKKVDKLVLVAPAGLMKSLPTGGKIITFPVFGKFIAHLVGRRILIRLSASQHNPDLINTPQLQQSIQVTNLIALEHPGFMRAYLSTVAVGPVRKLDERYRQVGEKFGDRVFCIWGNADTVVDFHKDSPRFKELVPAAKFVELDGIGHSLLVEIPEVCSNPIVEFLKA
ncbi:hypothetical protein HDU96_002190 [Phlyctochytrium bullatum]|nr:hypothetical protein HDU96_002190 [Phlyctochytrium bullatum]